MLKVTSNNPDGGDINQTIVEVGTGKTFTRSFNKNGSTITPLSDWVRLDNFGCNTLSSLASALGVNAGKLHYVTYAVDDTINLPYGITIICCTNYQDSMIAIMRMPVCIYKIIESGNNYSAVLDIIQPDSYSDLSVKIKIAGTYGIAFLGQ